MPYCQPRWGLCSVFLLSSLFLTPQAAVAQTNVLTNHNDNGRTGLNPNETLLTRTNVNTSQFGQLFTRPVDGYVYAQPLYVSNLVVPGKGTHNVLFIATEHNTVYAFDADGNGGPNAVPLWQVNLGPSVPTGDLYSGDLVPEVGITGTPTIDSKTGTLYLVAKTKENGSYVQRLHALALGTGIEKFGAPVVIRALVSGVGDDNDGQGNVPFNSLKEHQRGGLVLSNGVVYIPWASHGDNGPYHGWIMGYDAHTLKQTLAFNDTPNGGLGGIWMSGMAPATDAAGNLFFSTGNGAYDANLAGGYEYGDSVLRLDPVGKRVADYFTPYNQGDLNAADADLASGGVMLLPDQPGTHPHLLVTAGKQGVIYLVDRDGMGGFHAHQDAVVQTLPGALAGGAFNTPAYFKGRVFYQGAGDVLKAFTLGATTATTQNFSASSGFTPQGITLNGSAALSGSRVRLTDGAQSEAGSVWASNPVGVSHFSTSFQFQITNPNADGMTFTLQRAGTGALGATGGGLGYSGVGNSLCIKFDLYDNNGEGINSTGLYTNGQDPFTPATDLTPSGIDLHSGHPLVVTLAYDLTAQLLTVEIKDVTDPSNKLVATQTYTNLDIPAIIGGTAAYAGFTGGTGGLTATQEVLNWSYTSSDPSGPVTFYGLTQNPGTSATGCGFPGATPSISANGDANGIVWVAQNTNSNFGDHGSAFDCLLRAYNADDVTQELWNSGQAPGGRDHVGQYVKFSVPTVANGKVYVGTPNSVAVYGLIAQPPATDVTRQIKVNRGGFRYNAVTKQFMQIDTLTNIGTTPITGPLSLVLDSLGRGAVMANAYGVTQSAVPAGSPYINAIPSGALGTGQSTTVSVCLTKIGPYTPRVLAGPGSR